MPRLFVSDWFFSVRPAFVAVIAIIVYGAAEAAPTKPTQKISAGKPVGSITCDQAKNYILNTPDNNIELGAYNANMAVFQRCKAEVITNRLKNEGSNKKALATGRTSKDGKVVIFEIVSINPDNASSIKQLCSAAAAATATGTGNPTAILVVSAAGEATCSSYVEAALRSDPLLIIAPGLIPGLDITKDVLKSAGIPQSKIEESEKWIRDTSGKVGTSVVQGSVATASGGIVTIDEELRCATIFGKRVCR